MKQIMQQPRKMATIVVAAVIAIAMFFYMVTFQVRFTEIAVVTTFGKATRSIEKPGLYWKWPFPVQNVRKFDARIQNFESRLEEIFTSDNKNVVIATYLGWRVVDPIRYMSSIEAVKKNLEGQTRSYVNGVISQTAFRHLVSQRREDIRFAQIEEKVRKLLNEGEKRKDEQGREIQNQGVLELGIRVEVFGIQRLELPEKTTEQVFARMKEERKRIAESYRSQGKAQSAEIKAKAEMEGATLMTEAQANAKEIEGLGEAAAAEYYKVYAKNIKLAIWLRKLEALEKLLSEKTTLVLDTNTQPFDLLKGNLEGHSIDFGESMEESKVIKQKSTESEKSEGNKAENKTSNDTSKNEPAKQSEKPEEKPADKVSSPGGETSSQENNNSNQPK